MIFLRYYQRTTYSVTLPTCTALVTDNTLPEGIVLTVTNSTTHETQSVTVTASAVTPYSVTVETRLPLASGQYEYTAMYEGQTFSAGIMQVVGNAAEPTYTNYTTDNTTIVYECDET